MKHFLALAAQFKNEAPLMNEFLLHYRRWGVERFYLLNDNSTDEFRESEVYRELSDAGEIELIDLPGRSRSSGNRQRKNYDRYILELARKEAKWLAVCDFDEFFYSMTSNLLSEVLERYEDAPALFVFWKIFLTSNLRTQPVSVIEGNLASIGYEDAPSFSHFGRGKSIYNLESADSLTVHGKNVEGRVAFDDRNGDLELNHYRYQSLENLRRKKARGGGVHRWKYRKVHRMLRRAEDMDSVLLERPHFIRSNSPCQIGSFEIVEDRELLERSEPLVRRLHEIAGRQETVERL